MSESSPLLTVVLIAAVSSAGCNVFKDLTSPSTPATPSSTSDTFTGSVGAQGSSTFTFTVAQTGTVSVTLSTLSTSVAVGLGVGTPSGTSTCNLTSSNPTAVAGSTPQITVTENPGSYCVSVYDVGKLTGAATFSVVVAHP